MSLRCVGGVRNARLMASSRRRTISASLCCSLVGCRGCRVMSDDDPKPVVSEGVGRASGTSTVVGHARWFEQLPDEHSFYNMVGRVASEWAHFEHVLDLAIWELLSWKT